MDKKKKMIIYVIGISVILMTVGAVSYAYFSTIGQNDPLTSNLKTATLSLKFADNDNGVNAEMSFGETITKKFMIENTGSAEASLSIDWYNLVNTYLNGSLSYKLSYSEEENGEYEELLPSSNMPVSSEPITQTMAYEVSVPVGKTYYYNLDITLNNLPDVNQEADLNASFTTNFKVGQPLKYRYYTLRVNPNGGTWETFTSTQEYLLKNKETKEISTPTRIGHNFEGWTLKSSTATFDNTSFTMGIDDADLLANWTPAKYTVEVNGERKELDYGSSINLTVPEREGYTFTGWNTTGGMIEGNTFTLTEAKDITITPTYQINNYKYIVYHNKMNVSGEGYSLVSADTDEGEAEYNSTVTPPVKSYTGFTSPSMTNLTIKAETVYPPIQNKIEYNYNRNQYEVTTNLNGGVLPDNTSIPNKMYYEASVTLPTPTKTGYNFSNWTTSGGEVSEDNFTMSNSDATLTANWTAKTFSVIFNANGGSTSIPSKTVTYDSTYGELPSPTYEGYDFLGWFTESTGGSQIIENTPINLSDDITLYAHWEKQTAANAILAKANDVSVTSYTSGNRQEMFAFEHDEATQTTGWSAEERRDYRYIGNNPNNYITFNDETWRIIGVFTVETEDGSKEQLIKIIRNENIDSLLWDSNNVNEWSTASLKTLLNGDFYNQSGSYTSTSTVKGLSETAREQVENVKWYLGGSSTNSGLGGPSYYSFERGTTVYSERSTNIIAKVGLMYPSDYVYTYAKGVNEKCYTDGYNCKTYEGGTPTLGWLFNSSITQWTISPRADSSSNAFRITGSGYVYYSIVNYTSNAYGVRPSVYLKSNIQIKSGTGASGDPYIIG